MRSMLVFVQDVFDFTEVHVSSTERCWV